MDAILHLITAFGISAPAGLNAYLTLLLVGLIARFTDWLTLRPPFDVLANEWVLAALVVLVAIEILVDKVPGVDSLNDILGTVIRPVAGAIVFAASANVISDIHPVLGAILGLLAAGGVHLTKAAIRPPIQLSTGGVGGALVSGVEDALVVLSVILSVVAPLVALLLIVLVALGALAWWRRRRRAAVGVA